MVRGRSFVTPEDVKELAVPVLAHRLIFQGGFASTEETEAIVRGMMEQIPVPTEDWSR